MFEGILKISEDPGFNVSIPVIPGMAHMAVLLEGPDCSLDIRRFVLSITKRQILSGRKSSIVLSGLEPGVVQDLVSNAAVLDSTPDDDCVHIVDRSDGAAGSQSARAQGLSPFKVEV